ncbi:MAG TPA: DUF2268 domain-containing putative Zn-dependent protease, partial [Blastocatellia bacterium]|nr:DUF2268 domain-containing putative Zn-dependent protease [Blastocatellia bacterium]
GLPPAAEIILDGNQIVNMLPDVLAFWDIAQGKRLSHQRALWVRMVESKYKDYFERAVYRGADQDSRMAILDSFLTQLPSRIRLIRQFASRAPEAIVDAMIDFKARFPHYAQARDIYLGVSLSMFDGAVKPVGNPFGVPDTLCLAADILSNYSPDQLKILLVHEVFHLYHFDYLFAGVYKQYNVGLVFDQEVMNRLVASYVPLMVEGMAVEASEEIYPGYPLTMYLHYTGQQLADQQDELVQSAQDFLEMIKSGALPYQYDRWFNGNYDGIPRRGGYLLGYEVTKRSLQSSNLELMMHRPPEQLGEEAVNQLSTMIGEKVVLMASNE